MSETVCWLSHRLPSVLQPNTVEQQKWQGSEPGSDLGPAAYRLCEVPVLVPLVMGCQDNMGQALLLSGPQWAHLPSGENSVCPANELAF